MGNRSSGRNENTRYRLSGSNRSYEARRRTRRKKKRNNTKLIIMLAALFVGVVGITSFAVKSRLKPASKADTLKEESTQEISLSSSVLVDDIDITGMSKEQAHDALLKKYDWAMKASLNGETYELGNLVEAKINSMLEEIFSGSAKSSYTINFDDLDDEIAKEVKKIEEKWNVKAKNASLESFDKASNTFVYADGKDGIEIDSKKLSADIAKALSEKNLKADIAVSAKVSKPEIATKDEVKSLYKVIGTFTTNTTSNKDRNTNIEISCAAMDGLVLQPGEEFSFNNTTGNRTLEKGYKPAGAYLNGVLVAEPGGGVCQVSSTLYNAVVFSGLTTTERHAHSFEPSYVQPGEDAMVSYDGYAGPDMKFVNNSKAAIALRAKLVDKKLTISIIGLPILAEDEKIYMHSTKSKDFDEPAPNYEEDATVTPGSEMVITKGTKGSRWVTNIIRKKGDTVVSDEFLHNSTYRGKSAIIKRNTTGAVAASTNETLSSQSEETQVDVSASAETQHKAAETTKAAGTTAAPKASTAEKAAPGNSTKQASTAAETTTPGPTVGGPAVTEPAGPTATEEFVPPHPGS